MLPWKDNVLSERWKEYRLDSSPTLLFLFASRKNNLALQQKLRDECPLIMHLNEVLSRIDCAGSWFLHCCKSSSFLKKKKALSRHFHFRSRNTRASSDSRVWCGWLCRLVQKGVRTWSPGCGCWMRRVWLSVSFEKILLMLFHLNLSGPPGDRLLLPFIGEHSAFLLVIFQCKYISIDRFLIQLFWKGRVNLSL